MSSCGMWPRALTPTLFLVCTKALKPRQDPLLLKKKAIWKTFIIFINHPFFHSWHPTPTPGPAVCADREQCVSLDTKDEWRNVAGSSDRGGWMIHGNLIKHYHLNGWYRFRKKLVCFSPLPHISHTFSRTFAQFNADKARRHLLAVLSSVSKKETYVGVKLTAPVSRQMITHSATASEQWQGDWRGLPNSHTLSCQWHLKHCTWNIILRMWSET